MLYSFCVQKLTYKYNVVDDFDDTLSMLFVQLQTKYNLR